MEAGPAAGLVAGDAVGVVAGAAVDDVVADAADERVVASRAVERVVARVAVDADIATHQRGGAEIEQVGAAVVDHGHGARGARAVDGFHAGAGPADHADVHVVAVGLDRVGAGAVDIGVVALEAGPALGLRAGDAVGVVAQTAVEAVLVGAGVDQVVTRTAENRVVAAAAPDQVVAGATVHHVVAAAGDDFLGRGAAGEGFSGVVAVDPRGALVEVVQPVAHVGEGRVGIAVLVEEVVALDLEPEVVEAVGDRVDEVLAEVVRVRAVVLDQVVAGLLAVLVIAVQRGELRQARRVAAHPGVHGAQVFRRDPAVAHRVGGGDGLHDQLVERVGVARPGVDVGGGRVARQSRVGLDRVDDAVQPGAGARLVDVEIVQPRGHVGERRVGVAVLVEQVGALDLEADVVDPVQHRVDQVLAEILGVGAVVLDQVVAGFLAVLVVAVQGGELRQPGRVRADPGVEGRHVGHADRAVRGGGIGGGQALRDQLVQAVGGVLSPGDVGLCRAGCQPRIGLDQRHGPVQPGAGGGAVLPELRQPARHLLDRGVGVAILVEESAVLDLEPHVVDAVDHRVEQVLPAVIGVGTVVLHLVITGFLGCLVVAMQRRPLHQAVGADPGVHRNDLGGGEDAVRRGAGGQCCLDDDPVELVGRRRPAGDLGRAVVAREAVVGVDRIHQLVQTGARRAVRAAGHRRVSRAHAWFLLIPDLKILSDFPRVTLIYIRSCVSSDECPGVWRCTTSAGSHKRRSRRSIQSACLQKEFS